METNRASNKEIAKRLFVYGSLLAFCVGTWAVVISLFLKVIR